MPPEMHDLEALLRLIATKALTQARPVETRKVMVVAGTYQQCLAWARSRRVPFERICYGSSERQFFGISNARFCGYVRTGTWYSHPLFRRGQGWNLLRMLESRGVPDLSRNPGIDEL
jgi:hypothetical protein